MNDNNIRNIIRQLAGGGDTAAGIIAKVVSVDTQKRTIDAEPLDGSAPLLDVNLQANQGSGFGLVVFPKVGSYVVVGPTCGGSAFVVWVTDEIDRVEIKIGDTTVKADRDGIVFNGGSLGGLVKIDELTQKLNGLTDTVNSLIEAYNSHKHVTTATVGPTTTPGEIWPTISTAQTATPFNKDDYENKLIKQ